MCVHAQQFSLTLCNHKDCSLPGSSVHGIFQTRYWSGLTFPSPGNLLTQKSNRPLLFVKRILNWATWEVCMCVFIWNQSSILELFRNVSRPKFLLQGCTMWTSRVFIFPYSLSKYHFFKFGQLISNREPFLSFFFNLIFFQLIYFNWRLVILKYCGGFCHTSTWISHRHTSVSSSWNPLLPPSPPQPSGLSQGTSFECPALCIELALVIYFTYGNIHISMLFFQIISPSPST